jgi:hypothetical protein
MEPTLMSGSPEAPQYDDWSPGASWRAAEQRGHGSDRRVEVRLPALPTRHLRFAACVVAVGLVGLFAARALHLHVAAGGAAKSKAKPEAKTFAWVPVRGARSYVVEFVGKGRVIYLSNTRAPRLKVPAFWTYRGRRHALRPGAYHWYVWPILRTASGSHRGRPSVSSTLKIAG